MSSKIPATRKSLIEPGSILSGPTPSGSMLDNVIGRDREKSGRAAPSGETQVAGETLLVAEDQSESSHDTELLTDLSKQVSTSVSKPLRKQVSKSLNTSLNTHLEPQGSKAVNTQAGRAEPPQEQSARRRLLSHAEKEAVTRLSIDVPMSMYGRIKQYIAVNNVESIRALTLALYEDFLIEEGF